MAIPDGKPATDFSAMNREWVRAVAEEAVESGGGIPAPASPSNGDVLTYNSTSTKWEAAAPAASGIPAPANPSNGDVLTYSSTDSAWVAAAPGGGGGGGTLVITVTNGTMNKTAMEIYTAYMAGTACIVTQYDLDQETTSYCTITEIDVGDGGTYAIWVGAYSTMYGAATSSDYPAAQM